MGTADEAQDRVEATAKVLESRVRGDMQRYVGTGKRADKDRGERNLDARLDFNIVWV